MSTNHIDYQSLRKNKDKFRRVFFYRVCGTGMGAAACLLKEQGLHVEGADTLYYPPMSDYLKRMKIPMHKVEEISDQALKEFDLIVVGNVVPNGGPDAKRIEALGIPYCSFPAAMGALVLEDVNVVGIAGTHGKTTTTYFATQVFENLGEKPGYFIGGVLDDRPSSKLGEGKYFFIESDEYDSAYFEKISKFRLYALDHMVLTSLEFDHADIFKNIDEIKNQFRAVLNSFKGKVIFHEDYIASRELKSEAPSSANWIGYGEKSEHGPRLIHESPDGSTFELKWNGQILQFETNVVGWHNILNLSSIVLYALSEGFSREQINPTLKNLQMVRRRQEVRGRFKNLTVIDDFAHHPTAVELTIRTIKTKFPNKPVFVIFEPNSATARSSIFQDEFEKSFMKSSGLIVTKPARPTSVKWAKDLDYKLMTKNLSDKKIPSFVAENLQELRREIDQWSSQDGVLLILSNGTCLGLWESDFVQGLQK
ncbi:MAG: Mur ligase domain-containing protein [Bacteriovoracaceae bacterium]